MVQVRASGRDADAANGHAAVKVAPLAARGPIMLDGDRLSSLRGPGLAARARAVATRRGEAPRIGLIAFADASGRGAYSGRKIRACAHAGVEARRLLVPFGSDTDATLHSMHRFVASARLDAVFLEFPFPEGVDGDALIDAIPPALDVDIMTPARSARFMAAEDPRPPLTVAAGLALLDGYTIDIGGRSWAVLGDDLPFTHMFAEALVRRGAGPGTVVLPGAPDLEARVASAQLAVVSVGRPHFLPASLLAADAVAIDVGYFNAGGRGDIDPGPGIGHLAAFSPVPGGIGPMTISVLIERVIEFAEGTDRAY